MIDQLSDSVPLLVNIISSGVAPTLRAINSLADWIVWDTARDTYNVAESLLYANLSGAEDEGIADRSPDVIIDVLSNGFKCRGTNNDLNASEDYLFCAFAETPFKYSNAR